MGNDKLTVNPSQPDPVWDELRTRIATRNQDSCYALEDLVNTFSRRILSYIGRQLYKEYSLWDENTAAIQSEVMALTNAVFYRAWNEIGKFDPERGSMEQWLINLAWQEVKGFIRKDRKRRLAEALFTEETSLLQKALENDNLLKEAIIEEVAQLSTDKQEIFYLYYVEDWQVKEIALHTSVAEGSIKRILHEVREAIKAKMI